MKARIGDRLVLAGPHVGEAPRMGVIIDIRHEDGSPPYLVRWLGDGHEGLIYPGPDAHLEPPAKSPADA